VAMGVVRESTQGDDDAAASTSLIALGLDAALEAAALTNITAALAPGQLGSRGGKSARQPQIGGGEASSGSSACWNKWGAEGQPGVPEAAAYPDVEVEDGLYFSPVASAKRAAAEREAVRAMGGSGFDPVSAAGAAMVTAVETAAQHPPVLQAAALPGWVSQGPPPSNYLAGQREGAELPGAV